MAHTHTVKFYNRAAGGTVYEVCECGAVRITMFQQKPEPWHSCKLCVREELARW